MFLLVDGRRGGRKEGSEGEGELAWVDFVRISRSALGLRFVNCKSGSNQEKV